MSSEMIPPGNRIVLKKIHSVGRYLPPSNAILNWNDDNLLISPQGVGGYDAQGYKTLRLKWVIPLEGRALGRTSAHREGAACSLDHPRLLE